MSLVLAAKVLPPIVCLLSPYSTIPKRVRVWQITVAGEIPKQRVGLVTRLAKSDGGLQLKFFALSYQISRLLEAPFVTLLRVRVRGQRGGGGETARRHGGEIQCDHRQHR